MGELGQETVTSCFPARTASNYTLPILQPQSSVYSTTFIMVGIEPEELHGWAFSSIPADDIRGWASTAFPFGIHVVLAGYLKAAGVSLGYLSARGVGDLPWGPDA